MRLTINMVSKSMFQIKYKKTEDIEESSTELICEDRLLSTRPLCRWLKKTATKID